MKNTDLMIGDWVYIEDGDQPNGLSLTKVCSIGLDNTSWLHPIPLTEEILKANGFFEYNPFKTIDYKMYAFPEQCNIKKERGFGIEIGNDSFGITDHCLMPIKYVHEFQHALRLCGLNDLADNFKVE